MKAERTAFSSSIRSPAAVVPPGDAPPPEVAGSSPVSASIRAEPTRVPTASSRLAARGRPARTPASMSASATRKT